MLRTKSYLVGSFVTARSTHGGKDLVQTLGSNAHEGLFQGFGPCRVGLDTQGGAVDEHLDHLRAGGCVDQGLGVVSQRQRCDLTEQIQVLADKKKGLWLKWYEFDLLSG